MGLFKLITMGFLNSIGLFGLILCCCLVLWGLFKLITMGYFKSLGFFGLILCCYLVLWGYLS